MTTLLLFDIDGTLLHGATDAHRDALHGALHAVHGVKAEEFDVRLSPAGRTDNEIARIILLAARISAVRIDERASMVREECCRLYARLAPDDLSGTVVPGIPRLLGMLTARGDATLGLVTGNFEPVARLKLTRAGIGHFFAGGPGGFGSDSEDRAALPAIARRRAGAPGRPHPRADTVVIGDTPRDIACARADGVRCLAVSTGPHAATELADADWVASGTDELDAILRERVLSER